jgi:hypothetical protein
MRHVAMGFWLVRRVLPAILAYWSRRLGRGLWQRIGGAEPMSPTRARPRRGDVADALMDIFGLTNAMSYVLLLVLFLVAFRLTHY